MRKGRVVAPLLPPIKKRRLWPPFFAAEFPGNGETLAFDVVEVVIAQGDVQVGGNAVTGAGTRPVFLSCRGTSFCLHGFAPARHRPLQQER